jgi:hypothetical protein
MNTLVLHGPPDKADIRRWGLAAAIVIATHVALVAGFVLYTPPPQDAIGTASEPIMLDLESAPETPEPVQQDIAPGPTMQEAEPPAPEPEKQPEVVEEQIAPTPVQEKAEVVAPPEKPKPKPEPIKKKPKPVVEKPKKPTDNPAPQTTATPRAAGCARQLQRHSLGASAALQAISLGRESSRRTGCRDAELHRQPHRRRAECTTRKIVWLIRAGWRDHGNDPPGAAAAVIPAGNDPKLRQLHRAGAFLHPLTPPRQKPAASRRRDAPAR